MKDRKKKAYPRAGRQEDQKVIAEPSTSEYVIKNRIQSMDATVHGWYRFVLGYPPHFVRECLNEFDANPLEDWVFDPFCGTATTPVEARLKGFSTVSIDANPIAVLATRVKLNWDIDIEQIRSHFDDIIDIASHDLDCFGLCRNIKLATTLPLFSDQTTKSGNVQLELDASDFNPDQVLPHGAADLIPGGFISKKPLLRVLALRHAIDKRSKDGAISDFLNLALANVIVTSAGNIGFGPEIYRLPPKEDVDVLDAFRNITARMIFDLDRLRERGARDFAPAYVFQDDARILLALRDCPKVGVVITSPPYPNEKDYTRSTRLESVLLGLITSQSDLRKIKAGLLRSNTRNVFVGDDDDSVIQNVSSITELAKTIEEKRIELGKTSGFERLYHRVTLLYFGGMYRHLLALFPILKPGARCAYLVGDQMSYFRIHIPTARLLADLATRTGYNVEGIKLWRTRRSTTTKQDLEENVLVFKRP